MNLHKLPQITVVEGLHLARRRACKDPNICSYALAELLVLRVLVASRDIISSPGESEKPRSVIYLRRGPNFSFFNPQAHHNLFLQFFEKENKFPLHTIARGILQKGTHYRKTLIETGLSEKGVGSGGMFGQNQARKSLQKFLKTQFRKVSKNFPDQGNHRIESSRKIISNLGPLFLIAPTLEFEELPQLMNAFEGIGKDNLRNFLKVHAPGSLYQWGDLKFLPDFTVGSFLNPLLNSFENFKFLRLMEDAFDPSNIETEGGLTFY